MTSEEILQELEGRLCGSGTRAKGDARPGEEKLTCISGDDGVLRLRFDISSGSDLVISDPSRGVELDSWPTSHC